MPTIDDLINAFHALSPSEAELEKAESERNRLQQTVETATAQADKVVTMLPRAKERYQALVEGIGALSATHLPQAIGSRCGHWSGTSA